MWKCHIFSLPKYQLLSQVAQFQKAQKSGLCNATKFRLRCERFINLNVL